MPLRRGQRHREVRWVDICHALYMTGYMEDFSEAGALPVCAVAFIKAWAAESGRRPTRQRRSAQPRPQQS